MDELARKLGIAGEQIWPEAVQYTFNQAIAGLVANVFALVLILGLAAWGIPYIWNSIDGTREDHQGMTTLAVIFTLIMTIVVLANISNIIPILLNPVGATATALLKNGR